MYEQANQMIVDDCAHVFIAHSNQILAFNSSVKGYVMHPTTRKFFYNTYIEE